MQDRDLYQQLLCLDSPWTVSQVELNAEAEEVLIHVAHPRGTKFCCPDCDRRLPCYDHAQERRWRHLDSCQFQTILVARTPRVKCPEHGVKTVSVPWAAGSSRFTLLFERFAIDVLLATQTVTGAMSLLRTTWDETWHILKLAVERGQDRKQARAMPRIGIDEKAFAKRHKYVTLIYDLDHSTVEAISDGNDTQAGIACFSQLSNDQLAAVEAVAMDMSAAYVKAAMETIPDAQTKIVHDRFHVMQLATKAVDTVRRGEHRELKADGDNRLAKTKYLWLTNEENLSEKQASRLAAGCRPASRPPTGPQKTTVCLHQSTPLSFWGPGGGRPAGRRTAASRLGSRWNNVIRICLYIHVYTCTYIGHTLHIYIYIYIYISHETWNLQCPCKNTFTEIYNF